MGVKISWKVSFIALGNHARNETNLVLFGEIVLAEIRKKCADLMDLFSEKIRWLNGDEVTGSPRTQNDC
jgi:hypothetical protein